MKKYLLIGAISAFSATTFAQKATSYCDLDVYRPGFKNYIATANFGNGRKNATKANALKDASGRIIKFVSEVEAVNYMAGQGWELVTSYHTHGGDTHFFLKKVS